MKLICIFRNHKWLHIANFDDVTGGRGLFQCKCCGKLTMDQSTNTIGKHRYKREGNDIVYNLYH